MFNLPPSITVDEFCAEVNRQWGKQKAHNWSVVLTNPSLSAKLSKNIDICIKFIEIVGIIEARRISKS